MKITRQLNLNKFDLVKFNEPNNDVFKIISIGKHGHLMMVRLNDGKPTNELWDGFSNDVIEVVREGKIV